LLINEIFERQGEWLFKRRGYLPVLFVPLMVVALSEYTYPLGFHKYDLLWDMFAFSISIFGLFIRCLAVGYAPSGTSGRNMRRQKASTLNKEGMYSIRRNPLYLGNFFTMLGVAVFPRVWWLSLIYVLAFWLYYERIIFAEERFLKERFGVEYEEYCSRVPVFIPDFKLWIPPKRPFSFKRVLRKEYSSFFSLVATFTCSELVSEYFVEGRFVLDPVWASIFLLTFFACSFFRLLKSHGALLNEEG